MCIVVYMPIYSQRIWIFDKKQFHSDFEYYHYWVMIYMSMYGNVHNRVSQTAIKIKRTPTHLANIIHHILPVNQRELERI